MWDGAPTGQLGRGAVEDTYDSAYPEILRKVTGPRQRSGQLGRFGVGIKAVLAAHAQTMSAGSSEVTALAQLGTGSGKTNTGLAVVVDGQHRVLALAELFPGATPQLRKAWDAPARPAWLEPMPYASRRMRVRMSRGAAYRAMCRRVLERERAGLHEERRQHTGERRVRDGEARQAVLLRCEDQCENPQCFKRDLPYRTSAGKSLLQVDHIDDHAAGGRDHPSAMIALCPNCHANKTYGAGREALTEALRVEALKLHEGLGGKT